MEEKYWKNVPEEVLMEGKGLNESMEISEEIQELLVELSIGVE